MRNRLMNLHTRPTHTQAQAHHSCTRIATHTALDTPTHMFCRPDITGLTVTPKRNALPSGCSSLWAAATRGQHISHAPDPHSVTSSSSLPPHLGNLDLVVCLHPHLPAQAAQDTPEDIRQNSVRYHMNATPRTPGHAVGLLLQSCSHPELSGPGSRCT